MPNWNQTKYVFTGSKDEIGNQVKTVTKNGKKYNYNFTINYSNRTNKKHAKK